jgi:uncharacterized protein (UPF0548 family)
MFFALRPGRQAIERFIGQSQALPLSYSPIGLVRNETARHDIDEAVVAIGRGKVAFERARAALAAWKQFEIGWVELFPRNAPVEPGTVVAVLIRHLGFWSLNGCRVVYAVGDRDRGARFGFAYGTLTNHAEAGEELFEVFLNPDSDEVTYRIRAVSWPRVTLTRIGYPITRLLQARFRRDSAQAMRRATADAVSK